MKFLEIKQMEELQGGACTQTKQYAANVGCALVGASFGLITGGLGFAAGLACSTAVTWKCSQP